MMVELFNSAYHQMKSQRDELRGRVKVLDKALALALGSESETDRWRSRAQKAEAIVRDQDWEVLRARVAVLEAVSKVTSRAAFVRAARDVCSYCGKRSLPNEPEAHKVHGPNAAGNYAHIVFGTTLMCKASSIWSTIFCEDAADQRGEGVK